MNISPKTFTLIKIFIVLLCLAGISTILTLKIVNQYFYYDSSGIFYSNCNDYFLKKYRHLEKIRYAINTMIITSIAIQFILLCIYVYDTCILKPIKLHEIINRKLFILQYFLISLTVLSYLGISIYTLNFYREVASCNSGFSQNNLIQLIISFSIFILKLITLVLNAYLSNKCYSDLNQKHRKNSLDRQQALLFTQFQKDTKQIYQSLLNRNIKPFDKKLFDNIDVIDKQNIFDRNYDTKAQERINYTGDENYLKKDKVGQSQQLKYQEDNKEQFQNFETPQVVIDEQDNLKLDDKIQCFAEKNQQAFKNTLNKLSNIGYQAEQDPQKQKIILTKQFEVDNSPQARQARQIRKQNRKKSNDNSSYISQQEPAAMMVVVEMDTSKKKPSNTNVYRPEDLEPIQLDKSYYQDLIKKQKSNKQLNINNFTRSKKSKQYYRIDEERKKRSTCSYQKYLDEDDDNQNLQNKMKDYRSKTKKLQIKVQQQLCLYLRRMGQKNQPISQLSPKEQISTYFKDQIRLQGQKVQIPAFFKITGANIQGAGTYKNQELRQRKNPLETIRGKVPVYDNSI